MIVKRIFKICAAALLIITSLCGCGTLYKEFLSSERSTDSRNSSDADPENTGNFSDLDLEGKYSYIQQYLKNSYGKDFEINHDWERQWFGTSEEERNDFIATASSDGQTCYVWVTPDGEITDTVFLLDIDNEVEDIFNPTVKKWIPDSVAYAAMDFDSKPERTWTSGDDIETILHTKGAFCFVKVYVKSSGDAANAKKLLNDLSGYRGRLYIYQVDDLNDFDESDDNNNRCLYWGEFGGDPV